MKRVLSVVLALMLAVSMFVAVSEETAPVTHVELDPGYIWAPAEPAPLAQIVTEKGLWMHTGRSVESDKMVLIPEGVTVKMLAEYDEGWWRVSVHLGDALYTGYCWMDFYTEGYLWIWYAEPGDEPEPDDEPTDTPTDEPSAAPSDWHSVAPSYYPDAFPSYAPSYAPSAAPSYAPSAAPSVWFSAAPIF